MNTKQIVEEAARRAAENIKAGNVPEYGILREFDWIVELIEAVNAVKTTDIDGAA